MENNYKGMTKVLNNGFEATIIEFRDFYDIDVMLCTGEVSQHQQFIDFQRCDSAALGFIKKADVNEPIDVIDEYEDKTNNYDELLQPAFLYLQAKEN